MSVRFTTTSRGSEKGKEEILFEFLDSELSESMKLKYTSELYTSRFVGGLQTNQINGIYLDPIVFSGEICGLRIDANGNYITAKERLDQLLRLKGRIVKFFFEGIKQLVIIKEIESDYKNYMDIEYTITLQPHDIQIAVTPNQVKQYLEKSFIMANANLTAAASATGKGDLSFGKEITAIPGQAKDKSLGLLGKAGDTTVDELKQINLQNKLANIEYKKLGIEEKALKAKIRLNEELINKKKKSLNKLSEVINSPDKKIPTLTEVKKIEVDYGVSIGR